MAILKLNLVEFLEKAQHHAVLDVRSPSEYGHAHIPGAVSFPLFSDAERKLIGTAYKQESRETAIKIGLQAFGKNLVSIVEAAETLVAQSPSTSRELLVHCWRGGMRSAAVAWLLDLYGFKVNLLAGGYKSYRQWALKQFEKQVPLLIIGGYTGSNKTGIIHLLLKNKHPTIDLEGLARHKGSAFGNLDQAQQPTQEHFENTLALELFKQQHATQPVPLFLEGESQRIGNVNIPGSLFMQMRNAPLFFLDIPFNNRLTHIVNDYSKHDREKIINALVRIKKRLGGLETKNAIHALIEEDVRGCFAILLKYYDKQYVKSTFTGEAEDRRITFILSDTVEAKTNLEKILSHVTHH